MNREYHSFYEKKNGEINRSIHQSEFQGREFRSMTINRSNANINGAATAAFVVAAFRAIAVTTAFIASIGFAGRVNSARGYGGSRLGLNLGQNPGYRLLRNGARGQGHRGKWGYLHGFLPLRSFSKGPLYQRTGILAKYNQKMINHFMFELNANKLLIFNLLILLQAGRTNTISGFYHAGTGLYDEPTQTPTVGHAVSGA
jgi:hypothetical protein